MGKVVQETVNRTMADYILKTHQPPVLAVFGNALLDVQAVIIDKSIIAQYNLDQIFQKEIEEDEFLELYQEATKKCKIEMRCPGGSGQNTVRLFQWLIQAPEYAVFFGSIGSDENGKFLEDALSQAGVKTRYACHQEYKTGTCISFINGNRCLIAHLGAANHYTPTELDIPENWEILKQVLMIYVEGFFITHDFPTATNLVNFSNSNGICFGMNLNAPYVCENHGDNLLHLIKNADIVFGHTSEFLALSKYISSPVNSSIDVALYIQKQSLSPEKRIKKQGIPQLLQGEQIIVITAGRNSVSVIQGQRAPMEFNVPQLEKNVIKDTTGAGDGFVAGFLAAAFSNLDIEACVRSGSWTAQKIIQQVGVNVPNFCPNLVFTPSSIQQLNFGAISTHSCSKSQR